MTDRWSDIWIGVRLEELLNEPSHVEIVARTACHANLLGKTVLEVGSGSGGTGYELARRGARVTLVDLSPTALRLIRRLFRTQKVCGEYVCGDICRLPFPDKSFDVSVSYEVLEHFPGPEIVAVLREMRPASRRHVVTTVPNARCAFCRITKWYAEKSGTWQYGCEQPEESMRSFFGESGISVLHEMSIGFVDSLHFLAWIPNTGPLIRCSREFQEENPSALDGNLLLTVGSSELERSKFLRSAVPSTFPEEGKRRPPLVSVIMPAYQAAAHIGAAIQSVLAQSWQNFELLVIDDGSTDSTREIVEGFVDPRIRYAHKTNGGEADACNFGLKMARGELIAWLDADDLYYPDCLEMQVDRLLADPDLSLVYVDLDLVDAHGQTTGTVWRYEDLSRSEMVGRLFQHGRSCIPGRASTMGRKALYNLLGPFDTARSVSTDYDFLVRLVQRRDIRFRHIDRVLYRYRQVETGSSKGITERNRNVIAIMKNMLQRFPLEDLLPSESWKELNPRAREKEANYRIGAVFLQQGLLFGDRDASHLFLEEAERFFLEVLQGEPGHADSLLGRVEIHLARRNVPQAVKILKDGLCRRPHDTRFLAHAVKSLLAHGEDVRASEICREFTLSSPQDPIAFNLLGFLEYQHSHAKDAIVAFERAVQLDPGYHQARNNLKRAKQSIEPTSRPVQANGQPKAAQNQAFSYLFTASGQWSSPLPNDDEMARWRAIRAFLETASRRRVCRGERALRILDVGCGRGWLTNLASSFGRCDGIDPVSTVIEHARSLFPSLCFYVGEPEALLKRQDFKPYDLVLCSEVIEHVTDEDKPRFIQTLSDLLGPGGYAILTTPRGELYECWRAHIRRPEHSNGLDRIENWIEEKEFPGLFSQAGFRPLGHTRAYPVHSLVGEPENHGESQPRLERSQRAFGDFEDPDGIYQVWLLELTAESSGSAVLSNRNGGAKTELDSTTDGKHRSREMPPLPSGHGDADRDVLAVEDQSPRQLTLLYIADARSPHTQRLLNFFAQKGHRVHLFDISGDRSGLRGVRVHTPAVQRVQGFETRFLEILKSLQEVIEVVQPDIVHGHYITGWGWWGACVGFRPYVLTAWGSDVFLDPQFSAFNRRLNRYCLRHSSMITAGSRDLLQSTATLRGLISETKTTEAEGIRYVLFGIDLEKYRNGYDTSGLRQRLRLNGNQVILSLRQFKPQSNLETLIHAIPGVLKEVPGTVFILKTYLTPANPYEARLRCLVKDLGVDEHVRFLSDLPAEEIPVLYNLADIVVSLRETDSAACSILEAMACKVPIVASDISSMREWIRDGVNGLLVDPHESIEVKEALVSLLKDSARRAEFAEKSYWSVQQLGDYRKWWNLLEGLYFELLNTPAGGGKGLARNLNQQTTGWAYLQSGHWAEAEGEFRKATNPGKVSTENLVDSLLGLANCALKTGREKEAATFCRDAFALVQKFELDQMINLVR